MDREHAERARNRRLAEIAKRQKADVDDAIRALVMHSQGRQLIYWLLELGQMGKNPHSLNALATAFACGEMNVSQKILDRLLEVAPTAYVQMLTEKEEERLNAERPVSDTDASTRTDAEFSQYDAS